MWGPQLVIGTAAAPYNPTVSGAVMNYATNQPATTVINGLSESYAYDSFGNILQNGSFNDSYTANNQMFDYAYDAAGNLLSNGLFNVMTWDAESRIKTVGGANYLYDALGNRVEKSAATLTDTVYFGGQPIARLTAGQWTDLIYGPTGLLAEVPGTQTALPVYRVTDHLGTTVGNLLADGTFVNPLDYTPFGQIFSGNTSDPYLFTGYERDAESGLDYASARHYASNTGRFISPDPSGLVYADATNPQSLNLYSYVANNPMAFVDPSGLMPCATQVLNVPANGSGGVWGTDPQTSNCQTNPLDGLLAAEQITANIQSQLAQKQAASATSSIGNALYNLGTYSSGAADFLTFGLTKKINQWDGGASSIGYGSGFYTAGKATGIGMVAAGGVGLAADVTKVEAGEYFGTRFGGNKPLFNSPTTLRVGWSYIGKTSQYVFRIGGTAVGLIKTNPHINLWPPSWWFK